MKQIFAIAIAAILSFAGVASAGDLYGSVNGTTNLLYRGVSLSNDTVSAGGTVGYAFGNGIAVQYDGQTINLQDDGAKLRHVGTASYTHVFAPAVAVSGGYRAFLFTGPVNNVGLKADDLNYGEVFISAKAGTTVNGVTFGVNGEYAYTADRPNFTTGNDSFYAVGPFVKYGKWNAGAQYLRTRFDTADVSRHTGTEYSVGYQLTSAVTISASWVDGGRDRFDNRIDNKGQATVRYAF